MSWMPTADTRPSSTPWTVLAAPEARVNALAAPAVSAAYSAGRPPPLAIKSAKGRRKSSRNRAWPRSPPKYTETPAA
jgi:hypothetical protein